MHEHISPLLGEHPCIVNICLGPLTVHYREVSLYVKSYSNVGACFHTAVGIHIHVARASGYDIRIREVFPDIMSIIHTLRCPSFK